MKISATFTRATDGMVVATIDILRTENDPMKLQVNVDGENVLFTTESKSHQMSKSFQPKDVGGAGNWAKKVAESIKKQIEVYRIPLPENFELEV